MLESYWSARGARYGACVRRKVMTRLYATRRPHIEPAEVSTATCSSSERGHEPFELARDVGAGGLERDLVDSAGYERGHLLPKLTRRYGHAELGDEVGADDGPVGGVDTDPVQ